jgi:hypothetical protein
MWTCNDWLPAGRSGDRFLVGASTSPDRPWGPPSLLYNGYRVFPGGKERPGRDNDPSPPSSAVGHERVELYLYSPYGPYGLYKASVPVQRCTLLHFYTRCDAGMTRRDVMGRARYRCKTWVHGSVSLSLASHRRNRWSPRSIHTDVGIDRVCAGTGRCFSLSTFVVPSLNAPHSIITDSINSL